MAMSNIVENIEKCEECPFCDDYSDGDGPPAFVHCTLTKDHKLIPDNNKTFKTYGDPPPSWCPLRINPVNIKYEVK